MDIYQQCRPDIMHSLAIGMDSHLISAIVYAVSDNLRIETGEVDRTGRAKTLLPSTSIGLIWSSNAKHVLNDYTDHNCGLNISEFVRTRLGKVFDSLPQAPGSMQAVEFETLLLVLPFVLDNLFPEVIVRLRKKVRAQATQAQAGSGRRGNVELEYEDSTPRMIRLLVRYITWRTHVRKAWISESEIRSVRAEAKELMKEIKICFPKKTGQPVGEAWAIPKFHELLHHADNMLLFGTSENTSCNSGEQKHKATKRYARRSNQRNVNEQIMTHEANRNVLSRLTEETTRYAAELVAGGLGALDEAGVHPDSVRAGDRELHAFVLGSQHEERRPPDWRTIEKAARGRARRVRNFTCVYSLKYAVFSLKHAIFLLKTRNC